MALHHPEDFSRSKISAKVLAKSKTRAGSTVTTLQVYQPRIILAEQNTHRVLSRSAASSRAIPVPKLIELVRTDAERYTPTYWLSNKRGMQGGEPLEKAAAFQAHRIWKDAALAAAERAEALHKLGVHKQWVNRLLEPFLYMTWLVTSTRWANYDRLRNHPDAMPEIHEVAQKMIDAREAFTATELKLNEWHTPYITSEDHTFVAEFIAKLEGGHDMVIEHGGERIDGRRVAEKIHDLRPPEARLHGVPMSTILIACISAARCARVSYKTFDGITPPIAVDLDLFARLLLSQPAHASPAEHVCYPDPEWRPGLARYAAGNLPGFIQLRKHIPDEAVDERVGVISSHDIDADDLTALMQLNTAQAGVR